MICCHAHCMCTCANTCAMPMALKNDLTALGWHLSPEGLVKCQEVCKEKGWTLNVTNIVKVALDMDLRTVGDNSLPVDVVRSMTGEVVGPLVLQIQKVKNVAMPSNKQHLPTPSRRMLRLQLTDSGEYMSAIESDGAIDKLSPTTAPGTKLRLKGNVRVVNGFLLLTRGGVEVLGGQAETLLKKWNLNKGMTDISRSRTGTASGPPPFVPLRDNHGKSNSRDNRPTSKQTNELSKTTNTRKLTQQNQQDPDKPTRTQMDKPAERLQRKPDRKPEASFTNKLPTKQEDATRRPRQDRGRQREDDDDEYQPSTRPTGDYQLADWFGKKLKLSDNKTSNWEDAITYDAMAEQLETSSLTTNHSHQHHYRNDAYSRRGNETQVREGTRYHRGRDRQERTDGFERAMRAPNERSHRSQQSEYPGTTNERHGTHRDNRTHIHNARGNRTHNERGSRTHYDRGNKTHYDRGNRTHYDRDKGASYDRAKYHTTTTTAHTDDRGNRTHYDRGKEASYDRPKSHTITTTAHTNGKQQQTDKQYGGPDGDSRKPYLPQESSRQQEQCYQPKRKEEAPVVKEVWMQSSASSSDHWDWLGSTTTAVPFSAKRQN